MRFGWMAAAAAMVCAVPAQAVTWLRYQITGNGTETIGNGFLNIPPTTRAVNFIVTFSLEVDPTDYTIDPYSSAGYVSNGTYFTAQNGLVADGGQPGVLTVTQNFSATMVNQTFDARVAYNDGDAVVALPRALASSAALGTLNYNLVSGGGGRSVVGTITGFSILGIAPGLQGVQVTSVPEPATWLFMTFGIAGVGAALRRRPGRQSSSKPA